MLTLPEELMLISLREKTAALAPTQSGAVAYALAAAVLVELYQQKRLALKGDRVVVVSHRPVGDEWLDDLLKRMRQAAKPHKLIWWIEEAGKKEKRIRKNFLCRLVAQRILRAEHKHYLWVIPRTTYAEDNAAIKFECKQRLRAAVLAGHSADARALALLSLIRAADLLDYLFTRDEIKAARRRVDALLAGDSFEIRAGDAVRVLVEAYAEGDAAAG